MKRFLTVLLFCLFSLPSYGAFGAGTIWRVSTVSSAATNGGGYDPGVGSPGTDESTSAGVAITVTTASTTTGTGSPAFTSTTHGPGNFVHIASGTGCTVGWYEILSQAAGTATFDHAIAAAGGDTCVGTIGGPVATPFTVTQISVAGNYVCVKADGSYSISSIIGPIPNGTALAPIIVKGYTTTCGTGSTYGDAGQATIQATAGSGYNMIDVGNFTQISNFVLDCNSRSGVNGVHANGAGNRISNLLIENCAGSGINLQSGDTQVTNVRVTAGIAGCTSGIGTTGAAVLTDVVVDSNHCTGISISGSTVICDFVVVANNVGATVDGIAFSGTGGFYLLENSTIYGNGRHGINLPNTTSAAETTILNTIFWGNGTDSINVATISPFQGIVNCSAYPSGSLTNIFSGPNDVTLTVDPTVNGASLNFSLNETTGGGAAVRGTGCPNGTFFSSTAYTTMGAIQPLVNSTANLGGANAFVQ